MSTMSTDCRAVMPVLAHSWHNGGLVVRRSVAFAWRTCVFAARPHDPPTCGAVRYLSRQLLDCSATRLAINEILRVSRLGRGCRLYLRFRVTSCADVRGGAAVGGGDLSVHRYRGFDPSVGVRRGCDAGGAGWRMTRCCAPRSRPMTGFVFSHTGRRGGRGVHLADVGGGRRRRRAARTGVARTDGDGDRRGRATGRRLLRHGAKSGRAGDGRRPRRPDPRGGLDCGSARRCRASEPRTAPAAGLAEPDRDLSTRRAGLADGIPAVTNDRFHSRQSAARGQ